MCICASGQRITFYVAYTQIGNLRIGNLRMQRKKLCKPSYAYMRIRYGAKEITALVRIEERFKPYYMNIMTVNTKLNYVF